LNDTNVSRHHDTIVPLYVVDLAHLFYNGLEDARAKDVPTRGCTMCGRYDLIVVGQMLAARFGIAPEQAGEVGQGLGAWQPRYNIAPSQLNPVIVRGVTAEDQEKRLAMMKKL
jgi:hypothetical protein